MSFDLPSVIEYSQLKIFFADVREGEQNRQTVGPNLISEHQFDDHSSHRPIKKQIALNDGENLKK